MFDDETRAHNEHNEPRAAQYGEAPDERIPTWSWRAQLRRRR
jgi:hypothetical protein